MGIKSIGLCKWFNSAKGFGFLTDPTQTDDDIFVHYSSINMDGYKTLKEGDKVEYEFVVTDRGPQAHNVKKVP